VGGMKKTYLVSSAVKQDGGLYKQNQNKKKNFSWIDFILANNLLEKLKKKNDQHGVKC